MTLKEKNNFYHNLLINLHTLKWTMNYDKMSKLLDLIGNYSYVHTKNDHKNKHIKAFYKLVKETNKLMLNE